MMPYQSYQLFQIERPKSAAEIRRADEQAGRTVAAVTGIVRRLTVPGRRPGRSRPVDSTLICGRMSTTMEV